MLQRRTADTLPIEIESIVNEYEDGDIDIAQAIAKFNESKDPARALFYSYLRDARRSRYKTRK